METEDRAWVKKNHTLRNIIITVVILLVISGVIRACAIGIHNQNELENKSVPVPTLNAPTITNPYGGD